MKRRIFGYLLREGLGPNLVRTFAGSAGIRIAGMILGFLVGVQLARGLGASGYGMYGLAMSVISLLMIPVEFGLPQLVTREVALAHFHRDDARMHSVITWAGRIVVLLSLILVLGISIGWLILGYLVESKLLYTLVAGILLIPIVALANITGAALRGMQYIVRGQVPEIVLRPAFFSALLFVVTLMHSPGLTPASAMAMHTVAAALTLVCVMSIFRVAVSAEFHKARCIFKTKDWLKSTVPMALTEAMRVLLGNFSILIMGVMAEPLAVGVFRVASSMGLLLNMTVSLVHVASGPIISRLHASQDKVRLQELLGWLALTMVGGVAILTLPFVFFGERLLGMVFGLEFSVSNDALLVLSVGTIVGSAFGPGATLLNMTGHEQRVTRGLGFSL